MERFGVGSGEVSGVNPYASLKLAAQGDVNAQRELARFGLQRFATEGDLQSLLDGLCFARLAASQGGDEARGELLQMLALASDSMRPDETEYRASLNGEAIALVSTMADEGNPDADQWLQSIVSKSAPENVAIAQTISRMMAEA
ncbi:hypothetical protein A3736_01900 [Erythrobacter sp. HI0063]|nr:hypothetical protein A3736_01900 [Erythrobacter sp. HI0063]